MSTCPDRARVKPSTPTGKVRVQLDVAEAAGTVRGRLAVGSEEPCEFYGWFELIDALEKAMERHRSGHAVE